MCVSRGAPARASMSQARWPERHLTFLEWMRARAARSRRQMLEAQERQYECQVNLRVLCDDLSRAYDRFFSAADIAAAGAHVRSLEAYIESAHREDVLARKALVNAARRVVVSVSALYTLDIVEVSPAVTASMVRH